MPVRKNEYWSMDEISKILAQYYLLLGPRGTGKSTTITSFVLNEAYKSDTYQFAYLRRYDEDTKNDTVTAYFSEIDVAKLTHGKYNGVRAVKGWIYFVLVDPSDEHKVKYSRKIGKTFALNHAEHYKSLKYPQIVDIIYEEFITDRIYLQNEPSKLQELISTILRDRKGRVWLIGNTISRVCPYFSEWGLKCTRKMQGGDIKTIEVHGRDSRGEDYTTTIAVEICVADKSASGMFFGQRGKSITGETVWTGDRHNHLPKLHKVDYDMLYELKLSLMDFDFVVQLLCDNETGDLVNYIYPCTGTRKFERIITDKFSVDRMTSNCLRQEYKVEKLMKQLFRENKYCFSDDMTGDDFEHVSKSIPWR